MGKGAKPPDVVGAAEREGEFSRETARDVTYADRPDQYNPWGSVTWGQEQVIDPATGEPTTKWTQNESLSPDSQGLFDSQMGMMRGRSDLAGGMMGRIGQEMGTPADWNQFGDVQGMDYDPSQIRQHAEDASYQRAASRLDPRFAREAEGLEVKLRNQGLKPGDQAYDAQMGTFNTGKNDAYNQAIWGATSAGQGEAGQLWDQQMGGTQMANALRTQQIDEYLGKRSFSLGEQEQLNKGNSLAELQQTTGGGQ
jgi:hypothetical protein